MRTTGMLLLSLLLLLPASVVAQAATAAATTTETETMQWTQTANLLPGGPAGGRHHPISFANETHAFVLTGSTYQQPFTTDFFMYEEATDQWTDLTASSSAFPGMARSFGYGVVLSSSTEPLKSKAYLGLGAADGERRLQDWWEFDLETHIWTRLADLPGPGRRHPAMNAVQIQKPDGSSSWEIQVGLGDGTTGNFNDWWAYTIETDEWRQLPDFPSSRRHHPFYFSVGGSSYAGLGHSDGYDPFIERDWYRFEDGTWDREADFASYNATDADNNPTPILVTTEARVAGTQFSIELPLIGGGTKSLGFVLSGDGDNHQSMATGEFHGFDPLTGSWFTLPPHPGYSRWAPGSFVMRGSTRAYFFGGYDRVNQVLFNDLWKIDLAPLFLSPSVAEEKQQETPNSLPASPVAGSNGDGGSTTDSGSLVEKDPPEIDVGTGTSKESTSGSITADLSSSSVMPSLNYLHAICASVIATFLVGFV